MMSRRKHSTGGHDRKLSKKKVRKDARIYFYCSRDVGGWNKLRKEVGGDNIMILK